MFERYRELQKRREDRVSPEAGFTLIELLIVIVVLGILAAIVIFSLTGVSGQSQVAACNTDAKSVETAVAAYDAVPGHNISDFTGAEATQEALLVPTILHTWPSASVANNGYAITMDGTTPGQVNVATKGVGAASYDTTGCGAA